LDIGQEVLHLEQARCDKTIQIAKVPLPMKRSRADAVIARTPLPNLPHPVRAQAPRLLKCQKSAIDISCKSDVVQPLLLPKAGGDNKVSQPKAGGDHNIPPHQMATFEVAKLLMKTIVFTRTPWSIISDEKYSMVGESWKLVIGAQYCQWALAGAPVGTPSVCQLPGGPSHIIDPKTRVAVRVYSIFCSSIGLMMILNHQKIHS